jgi:AbrB family looped-hinge helix DNA binding protein
MIISIDKRGSINLPSSIRNELGLKSGDYLDLCVAEGGALVLRPVAIYPSIWLSEAGLANINIRDKSLETAGPLPLTCCSELYSLPGL